MEAQDFAQTPRGLFLAQDPEPTPPATPFDLTPRSRLGRGSGVEPVEFYNEDGASYIATEPGEINRFKLSRTHFLSPEAAAEPLQQDDHRFHPGDTGVTVDDVLSYLDQNPDDIERVLDEERAGKNRSTILEKFEN